MTWSLQGGGQLVWSTNPYRFASFVGVYVSLVSVVCSVVIVSIMVVQLPKETLGPSAAANLSSQSPVVVFFRLFYLYRFMKR
jgi:hypothetical protein